MAQIKIPMTTQTPTETAAQRAAREWDAWCARIYLARQTAEKAARNSAQPEMRVA